VWQSFFAALAIVFVAELPDKTMFATIVLTARYRRPWAVFIGVNLAMVAHAVLAAAVGETLRRLPDRPVQLAVAAMFLIGGWLMLRDHDDPAAGPRVADAATAGGVIAASAMLVGLAEFGDFTQLATIGVVAKYGYPVAAAAGSVVAHAAVAGLAVAAGSWLQRRMPVGVITRVAAVLFIVFGVLTVVTALR
jgi:putative Ca2+/H+ antiporter (TMEM165/GDT1 family)